MISHAFRKEAVKSDIIDVYTDVYHGKHSEEEISDALAQAEVLLSAVCDMSLLNEESLMWFKLAVCAQAEHIADTEGVSPASGASADGKISRISIGDYSCSYSYSGSASSGTGAPPSAVCRSGSFISLSALAFLDRAGLSCRSVGLN